MLKKKLSVGVLSLALMTSHVDASIFDKFSKKTKTHLKAEIVSKKALFVMFFIVGAYFFGASCRSLSNDLPGLLETSHTDWYRYRRYLEGVILGSCLNVLGAFLIYLGASKLFKKA